MIFARMTGDVGAPGGGSEHPGVSPLPPAQAFLPLHADSEGAEGVHSLEGKTQTGRFCNR